MDPQFGYLAAELTEWFDSVFDLTQRSLFGIAPEGPHRDAVVVDSMIRNARIIYRAELDREDKLYSPLCFFLTAACRHLGARLGTGHWRAALESLCQLQQLPGLEAFGLPLGTPAYRFKAELDAAIEQAGFIDRTSLLNKENRKVAIGLGINWAMRLLLACAADYPNPVESPGNKDFAWLATRVQASIAACN
ncbi:MAG: hypothetical protein ABSH42_14235 [Bryobacteraceae bacterium]|jgi:hypothetical protein